jgi:hypothetical protein
VSKMLRMSEADFEAKFGKSTRASSPVSDYHQKLERQDASRKAFQAKGHLPKGTMNGTESAYAKILEYEKHAGLIQDWRFHVFKVRLANGAWYETDFMVLMADDTVEIRETKGEHTTEKGQLKIRLCAQAMPWFRMVKMVKHKDGSWTRQIFESY